MFSGKTLLITGGTGSFGNSVLRRFLDTDIGEIRVFSRDEKKQEDMRIRLASEKVKFFIGDVREPGGLKFAMEGVDFVFQAAALKQVPSCEFYPMEAVRTNILGTENVINAAIEAGVKRVIALSTDKAVYPVNAMGMTKALMEKVVIARSRHLDPARTTLCCTRYGNVMASRGSVIPLFLKQIMSGESLTVTDPDMTRFLMSLDDAVNLVLYAFENGQQGDTFVQKSPASTIGDLAQALLKLFNAENSVRIIGTRHGEKLYETLLNREELVNAEDLGDYYRIPADNRDLNYNKYFVHGEHGLSVAQDYSSHSAERLDVEGVTKTLLEIDYVKRALAGHEPVEGDVG